MNISKQLQTARDESIKSNSELKADGRLERSISTGQRRNAPSNGPRVIGPHAKLVDAHCLQATGESGLVSHWVAGSMFAARYLARAKCWQRRFGIFSYVHFVNHADVGLLSRVLQHQSLAS